jgi:phosphoesterase RecJ-like protein
MKTLTEQSVQFDALVKDSQRIVIMMADNPDGDSVASALALEQIFGDMDKDVFMYCGVDLMPNHFAHLPGWDRVSKEMRLFELLQRSGQMGWVASRPSVVIDHHDLDGDIDFARLRINRPDSVATGEVIYDIAEELKWPLNDVTRGMLAASILSDSLGLMSEGTSARSIRVIADLVEQGVQLSLLENARRAHMKKSPDLLRYKGELLQRVEYYSEDRIATVTIPWEEIERYSHAYNPSMLVLDEMRFVENVAVTVAFKMYKDGKITGKIRCSPGVKIAGDLAESFGGGGHPYAAGFKLTDKQDFASVKAKCIERATELLDQTKQEQTSETP